MKVLFFVADYSLALEQLIIDERYEETQLKVLVEQADAIKRAASDSQVYGAYIWRRVNKEPVVERSIEKLARAQYVGKGTPYRQFSHLASAEKAAELLEKHGVEVRILQHTIVFTSCRV